MQDEAKGVQTSGAKEKGSNDSTPDGPPIYHLLLHVALSFRLDIRRIAR